MLKKRLRHLITVILFLAVFVVLTMQAFGCKNYAITTESMKPTYESGDMVIVIPCAYEALNAGDVITYFTDEGTVITHRVISVKREDGTVITKGDNNEYPDIEPVSQENIIGRVSFSIPKIGKILPVKTQSNEGR